MCELCLHDLCSADLDSLTEGGRGFPIINELTSSWGWNGDVNGRTVTVIFIDE
jgi:anti-sigma regulatory factor (Ser/Thr protein kinase)